MMKESFVFSALRCIRLSIVSIHFRFYRALFLCTARPSLPPTGLTIRAGAALGLSCLPATASQDPRLGSLNPFH
jgi:hypothetical protein